MYFQANTHFKLATLDEFINHIKVGYHTSVYKSKPITFVPTYLIIQTVPLA
jgi:hypothetical protein